MACEFKIERTVEFADTDMAGIMHFSNFFRFMESAEHAFYRSLGLSVDMEKSLRLGWPRVRAQCDYKRPLRFEDVVEIHLIVREIKEKAIEFEFIFRKHENGRAIEVARGGLTIVCVTRDKQTGKMKSVPIPPAVRAKIQSAPKQLWPGTED
jgi:acyl-CoA thioester hydrolase